MPSYSSREIIKVLQRHGWYRVRVRGSHHQLKHPVIPGTVTVPHPSKHLTAGTLAGIERITGIKFREEIGHEQKEK